MNRRSRLNRALASQGKHITPTIRWAPNQRQEGCSLGSFPRGHVRTLESSDELNQWSAALRHDLLGKLVRNCLYGSLILIRKD